MQRFIIESVAEVNPLRGEEAQIRTAVWTFLLAREPFLLVIWVRINGDLMS